MDEVEKADVTLQKDKIYVGDRQYTPQVKPPDPTEVLRFSLPRLNEVMSINIHCGSKETIQDNSFQAYMIAASSYTKIQDAYMKLRMNHADARHIICAWRVPGLHQYECNDHCDDQDYGASKQLLELMTENDINCTAIFVVRYCGEKLYSQRNQMYIRAAVDVIQKHPWNPITKTNQKIHQPSNQSNMDGQVHNQTYANAVRGRAKKIFTPRGGMYKGRGRGRQMGSVRGRRQTTQGNQRETRQYVPRKIDEKSTADASLKDRNNELD